MDKNGLNFHTLRAKDFILKVHPYFLPILSLQANTGNISEKTN